MKKTGKASHKVARTLTEFVTAKRRERCAVCQLPDVIRAQLKIARDKKITRDVVEDWLTSEHGFKVSGEELTSHNNGKHS